MTVFKKGGVRIALGLSNIQGTGSGLPGNTGSYGSFTVAFDVTGLSGQVWDITFNGGFQSTDQSKITYGFTPPGVYSFEITAPSGYTATPASGTVTVTDQNVTQDITFSLTSPQYVYVGTSGGSVYGYDKTTLDLKVSSSVVANGGISYLVKMGSRLFALGYVVTTSSTPTIFELDPSTLAVKNSATVPSIGSGSGVYTSAPSQNLFITDGSYLFYLNASNHAVKVDPDTLGILATGTVSLGMIGWNGASLMGYVETGTLSQLTLNPMSETDLSLGTGLSVPYPVSSLVVVNGVTYLPVQYGGGTDTVYEVNTAITTITGVSAYNNTTLVIGYSGNYFVFETTGWLIYTTTAADFTTQLNTYQGIAASAGTIYTDQDNIYLPSATDCIVLAPSTLSATTLATPDATDVNTIAS